MKRARHGARLRVGLQAPGMGMIEHEGAQSGAAVPDAAPIVALAADAPCARPTPPAPSWWVPRSAADLRGATLQWATGVFCAFVGAQMLVVPHQFGAQSYDMMRPNILGWGTATLIAGMAMI